jgi:hypothetical protein
MELTDSELRAISQWATTGKRENGLIVTDEWLEESFKKLVLAYNELRSDFDEYKTTIRSFETEFGLLLEEHKLAKRRLNDLKDPIFGSLVEAIAGVEKQRKKERDQERQRDLELSQIRPG